MGFMNCLTFLSANFVNSSAEACKLFFDKEENPAKTNVFYIDPVLIYELCILPVPAMCSVVRMGFKN